jgi:long-chain fatty acid transport protein
MAIEQRLDGHARGAYLMNQSSFASRSAPLCERRLLANRSRCLACVAVFVAVIMILSAAGARAGGFWLYEMGTPDLGTAAAGRAALAKDAATVFGNPAGMTKLDGSQLLVGTQLAIGNVRFDRGSGTTVPGGNGGNASGLAPGGSFYFSQSVTPSFKLGFWSGSYFGGALDYENDWSGRYYATEAKIITLGAGINGAYKINDWLSIGAGPFFMYGKLEQKLAVNNVLDGGSDGSFKFEDDEPGVGGMAGIMLEPWHGGRFGVTYISPVKLDFKDTPSTSNIGPTLAAITDRQIKLGVTVPQQVMLSAYQQLNQRWAVMGNVVWQDWSEFGQPEISVANSSVSNETANLNYDDTWGFALGAQYAFAEGWLWSVGGGFETSPMSESQRSPALPLDQQYRIGTGIQYSINDNVTVGAAYQYLNGGNASLDRERGPLAGRIQGDYQSFDVHFVALNLNWRF